MVYDGGEVPLRRPRLFRDSRPGGRGNSVGDAHLAELKRTFFCSRFAVRSAALASLRTSPLRCPQGSGYRRIARARASASPIFDASWPAPCALSGRPPPFPPTIGAI